MAPPYVRQAGPGPGCPPLATPWKGGVELSYPSGVVVDEKGNMFIADTCNSRIQLVSSVGQYIGEFGNGQKVVIYNRF